MTTPASSPNNPVPQAPSAPTPAGGTPTILSRDLADFLVEFSIALQKHAIYPAGHPLLNGAVEGVARRLDSLLVERMSLAIGVARRQLVIEGVATDPNHPLLQELAGRPLDGVLVRRFVPGDDLAHQARASPGKYLSVEQGREARLCASVLCHCVSSHHFRGNVPPDQFGPVA